MKKYVVELTSTERSDLAALSTATEDTVRRRKRALVLLAAHNGATDEEIAVNVGIGVRSIGRVRRRFVEEGLEAALSEPARPSIRISQEADRELYIVAQTRSEPSPEEEWLWRFRPQAHLAPAEQPVPQSTGRSLVPRATIVEVVKPIVGLLYVIGLLFEFFLLFHFVPFAIEGSRTVAVGVGSIVLIFLGMTAWRIGWGKGQASPSQLLLRTTGAGLQRQVIVSILRRGWLAIARNVALMARRRNIGMR